MNQVLEDMLCMYVMDRQVKCEDYLYLVEFAYNNGYHSFLSMSPFELESLRGMSSFVSSNALGYGARGCSH